MRIGTQQMHAPSYPWQDVYDGYAAVLSKPGPGVIRDAAELPYPKDAIKAVLLVELRAEKDQVGREALKTAYLHLADFQEMTNEERRAVAATENLFGSPPASAAANELSQYAKRLLETAPTYHAVLSRFQTELARLNRELEVFGDSNVPTTETIMSPAAEDVVRRIRIQRVLQQASKGTIIGWFTGLAWFAYSNEHFELGFVVWVLLVVGGMFAASVIIGGGVALVMATLTRIVDGRSDGRPILYTLGASISPFIAFFCAGPVATFVAQLLS